MELDGNTFVFVNKKYNHANLAMWGTGHREMGTYELKILMDQFWILKEDSNHPGYHYICNVKFEGYRLAKCGQGDKEVGSYGKEYAEDQLWRFVNVGSDGGNNFSNFNDDHYIVYIELIRSSSGWLYVVKQGLKTTKLQRGRLHETSSLQSFKITENECNYH